MAGLRKLEDATRELADSRILRNNSDLQKLVDGINGTLNPFDEAFEDRNLYCLPTRKVTSDEVKTDLLHTLETGQKYCNAFQNQCFENPVRFEQPIPRRKVKNFSSDAVKVNISGKDKKLKEIQGTQDLFGRLLYLAVSHELDLALVFSYSLTPVPLTLAHVDGSISKTDKSKLMHKLKERVQSDKPISQDACVVDAMFLIQCLVNIPATFGGLTKMILMRLFQFAKNVHFVGDSYKTPSMKDIEHDIRGSSSTLSKFAISGPDQKRPKNFNAALSLPMFKTALLRFLIKEWRSPQYIQRIKDNILIVSLEENANHYAVVNEKLQATEIPQLACNYEEADTRLIWHLKYICDSNIDGNVIVRFSDMDVLIILLTHEHALSAHVWLDVGISTNNTRRYIDVSKLAQNMGPELCSVIGGLYAFTGCDYTASFFRKGKIHPLALLEKDKTFIATFAKLGESPDIAPELLANLEKFVCRMYGKGNVSLVNVARHTLFQQHYAPKNESQPLSKIKGTDSSNLPPCSSVLLQKVKRANLVASMWRNAITSDLYTWEPEKNEWILENGRYACKWFESSQVPDDVCCHIEITDTTQQEDKDVQEYYSSSDESDSDLE